MSLPPELNQYFSQFAVLALDVDGTSVRNEPWHLLTVQEILKESIGSPKHIDWAWWQKNLGSGQDGIWVKLREEFPEFEIHEDDFINRWKSGYCELVESAKPEELIRPGMMRIIDAFKAAGKPVVAVSASERQMVEANLRVSGILPKLQFFMAAEDMRDNGLRNKPSGDPYMHACARLGIASQKMLVFEDTIKGVMAANEARAPVIGIQYAGQIAYPHAEMTVPEGGDLVEDMTAYLRGRRFFPANTQQVPPHQRYSHG